MLPSSTILQQKQSFRNKARHIAAAYYPNNRQICSQAMFNRLKTLDVFCSHLPLFCFVGTEMEPDTLLILRDALSSGRTVAVPRCLGAGQMEARIIHTLDELHAGRFGIPEPPSNAPLLPREQIGFAVVPCLCCGLDGSRLGHGGGYYDRYLANASFPWAVLCPAALLYEQIPTDTFDLKAPVLITETRTIRSLS